MPSERIVSIGFLTERDLEILGTGFQRHFPLPQDDLFADLIGRLDQIEISPLADGVALKTAGSDRGVP